MEIDTLIIVYFIEFLWWYFIMSLAFLLPLIWINQILKNQK